MTTEVWTWQGLVTAFVIDLASRRVQVVGSTPHPDDPLFMRQVGRTLTAADEGVLVGYRVLICDRDAKWSAPVRRWLGEAGIRMAQTPFQAPNADACAERFVRSIKHECLNRMIPLGERHLRWTIAEFIPRGAESPRARQRTHGRRPSVEEAIGFTVVSGSAGRPRAGRRAGD